MTSPANQQKIPATSTSATAATSYASAAGAPKQPSTASVVAPPGPQANAPGSSASPAQNAQHASLLSVNGKPVVTATAPASDHSRKSSVTMAASGPNSYANGGAVGTAKSSIQFGFDSPAMVHSTPQTGNSAPIPIPGGNPGVPSPANSPSPIPQPSASGGRPPSGLQQPTGQMTFGSLSSDGERHMRQGSAPPNPSAMGSHPGAHLRRDSSHSVHNDNPGASIRSNFPPQGGRGRGFHPHNNSYNNQMGYPPNGQLRHAGHGRGMPQPFQNQPRNMPYPNSPQPNRSPAMMASMPNTPNMPPANMQPSMPMQTPPQYHYPPPMAPQHQQNYGYPPQQMDQYGRPMNMPYGYGNMAGYMPPPQANNPGYHGQFVPPPYPQPGHSMSRNSSQHERPPSANQQSQPLVVASTPQQQSAQPKAGSNDFVKPKKRAPIQIKFENGDVMDPSQFKQPASPAPSSKHAKTPPAAASTPTPPPKPATPAHTRTDSQAVPKTAKEIQDELKEKIRQATQAGSEEKSKASHTEPSEKQTPDEKPAVEPKPAEVKLPEAKPLEPKASETEPETKPETKPAAATPRRVDAKQETKLAEQTAGVKPEESEEDEMERVIREMEEADAQREKEEEEHRKKREAEKAEAKKQEELNRKANAAEEDRKLRDQEREMERLEEEKERLRKEAEESGKSVSVAEALAGAGGADTAVEGASSKVQSVTDKLAGLKLQEEKRDAAVESAGQKPTTAEKRSKPAALNLAPLNTKPVEPPQPSAALQSLKSARFLRVMDKDIYPEGIKSPNPALNSAVTKKGKTFKYDAGFLLQFKKVFTEQPSVEFHQQVKSLISDNESSRSGKVQTSGQRQNSRGGQPFSFGAFNASGGERTLPQGTSSAQRFAMSNATLPRPPPQPMASFGHGAPFPGAGISRSASQSNMGGMGPNSPRQASRSTRSRRNDFGKDNKNMPLTAGQEVKPISVSASGWKATSIGGRAPSNAAASAGYLDPELVQRKVKAALNKMTPEKFDRIADQILEIASQSKEESDGRTLRQVIQLTFEKATDEAHWASMYAKFCKRMLETMSPEVRDEGIKDKNGNVVSGGNLFRKYLLNRCQEEFERGWSSNLPEQPEESPEEASKKTAEAAMMSDEYYTAAAAKRRGLGLVQFIGELFKLGMLTERIMHECVRKLVDYKGVPDEAEIESLTKLLRTVGANLDATEKGHPMMDMYFQRIEAIIAMPDIQSRMKFMLMDVVDLRRAKWQSKEANKGPKTLEEVRADAEAAQVAKIQEAARSNQRGGGGRPPGGRGDARNVSAGFVQQQSNQVGMDDLRRLKGTANRTSSQNMTLGPTSMFSSRSNSGRRLGPGGSLGRPGEESGASSRTGTPPATKDNTSRNTFEMLANMDTENATSPPSTKASPLMTKSAPESEKQEGE